MGRGVNLFTKLSTGISTAVRCLRPAIGSLLGSVIPDSMRLQPARAGTVLPSSAGVPGATPLLQTLVAAHFACRPTAAWTPTDPRYTPYKSNRDHVNCARIRVWREQAHHLLGYHAEPAGLNFRPRCPLAANDQLWPSLVSADEVRPHVHLPSGHSNGGSFNQSSKFPRGIGASHIPYSVFRASIPSPKGRLIVGRGGGPWAARQEPGWYFRQVRSSPTRCQA